MRTIGIRQPSDSKIVRDWIFGHMAGKTFKKVDIPKEICTQAKASAILDYAVKKGAIEIVGVEERTTKKGRIRISKVYKVSEPSSIKPSPKPKFSPRMITVPKRRSAQPVPVAVPVSNGKKTSEKSKRIETLERQLTALLELSVEIMQKIKEELRD